MFRYIALVWDNISPHDRNDTSALSARLRESVSGWTEVVTTSGLSVFCTGSRPPSLGWQVLPGGDGAVLGSLFQTRDDLCDPDPPRPAQITERVSQAIAATRGRNLVEEYWGNYVAFFRCPHGGPTVILKDPSGSLPCFHTMHHNVHVIFSWISDCLELGLNFTVDEEFLPQHMVGFDVFKQRSALKEVSQVHRGEALLIHRPPQSARGRVTREFYWTPRRFAAREQLITDADYSARAMQATVRSTARALASQHEGMLLRLSGGLDSSIIAGCIGLPRALPRFHSYTYYNPAGKSDERYWAAMAARHSGSHHIECPLNPIEARLEGIAELQPWIEPVWGLQYLARTPLERRLATDLGATAVLCGDGGDSGFCSDSIRYFVSDLLRDRGFSPRALWLAAQVARRTEQTTWQVLYSGVRQAMGREENITDISWKLEACHLVSDELRASIRVRAPERHPWLKQDQQVPSSYELRLGTLIGAPEFYDLSCRAEEFSPEVVSPLYSQPVIELLLRIPTYIQFHGGRDRGLARRAFTQEVPVSILRRQWKDRAPGFAEELVLANIEYLREALHDGELVRRGLLSRQALQEALSSKQARTHSRPIEVLRHLDTEMWARRWFSRPTLQTAA